MKFTIISTIIGVILFVASYFALCVFPKHPRLWKVVPREKYFGISLGIACLSWSAYHAHSSFIGIRPFLVPMVIIVSILSFFLLDFLFTRALGGFILLSLNWVLHEAFVLNAPFRSLLALICYLLAIAGFILIAAPYRFRDLLERISLSSRVRLITAIFLGLAGFLFCFVSAASYVR